MDGIRKNVNIYLPIDRENLILSTTDTKEKLMEVARRMVQDRGYTSLSFRDLAEAVGVKSASVHYYFPTKGNLGAALARRYTEDGALYLEGILKESKDEKARFKKYTDIFRAALVNENRMCLCGIMAAEYSDLPDEVKREVDGFTELNVVWLASLLALRNTGASKIELRHQALAIFAAIEGAQLIARSRRDIAVFDQTIKAYRAAGLLP
jgi:TetR/AcrR family transcriptional repressor of nem operon